MQRFNSLAFDREVVKLVSNDMPLFVGAIYVTIIFLALTFGKLTMSHNRILLAFAALPQVLLSLLFATGVQGLFGAKISTLNFMIGFILCGVGVDDMIVIEEFHKRAKEAKSQNVLRDTLREGGLAVFLTSLTSVTAFLVGSFVDLPAVHSFCVCSGLAFAYNFVLNITFFPAFLHLDERRCGMKCCKSRSASATGTASDQSSAALPFSKKIFVKYFVPALNSSSVQLIVAVGSIGAAVAMLLHGRGMDVGLDVREVVPDESHVVDFFDTLDDKFGTYSKTVAFVAQDVDYRNSAQVGKLEGLFDDLEAYETVVGGVGGYDGHWLHHYQNYLSGKGLDKFDDFGKEYTTWLLSSTRTSGRPCASYALDVNGEVNESGDLLSVRSSRFFFQETTRTGTAVIWDLYKDLEKLREDRSVSGYFFLELFLFAENDSLMFKYLFRSVGQSLLAVSVIMLIFTDAMSTACITVCLACINCHLLGISRIWDTKMNSVVFVCMVMSVGLSVDYCVHIAHAFVHAKERSDPKRRFEEALMSMGPAVLKGGFSTFLGVSLLSMASSSVFRIFFKMLFLTVVAGMFYGIVVLSTLMALQHKAAAALGYNKTKASKVDTTAAEHSDNKAETEMAPL